MNKYVNFKVPYTDIYNILNSNKYSRINFFIDLQSICTGFYRKENIFFELSYYIENNKKISNILIKEYANFLNGLIKLFKSYKTFFVTFYDDGVNLQNKLIDSTYKEKNQSLKDILSDFDEINLHYEIKKYYFNKINNKFNIENYGKVFYLKDYESDCVPWYCISNKLYETDKNTTINLIFSNDKDLLQCCQFNNTFHCVNKYFKTNKDKKYEIKLYNNETAIQCLDRNLEGLTSKYIPLILTISGDDSDNINGLKGYGYNKSVKLIKSFNLPNSIFEIKNITTIPNDIINNFDLLVKYYKMISFEEQIGRIDKRVFDNNIIIESPKEFIDEFYKEETH